MENFVNELEHYRQDMLGADNIVHLNNAGASLSPEPVIRTIIEYIRREAEIGGYEAATEAQEQIAHTYQTLARLVGANSHEIAFVDSATRAWNTITYALPLSSGDRILTSQVEFGTNVVSLAQIANRTGATIEVIPSEPDGRISLGEFEKQLDDRVKLVAITHVPAQRGVINPIVEIGDLLQNHPAFYLVDACQSVGQMPVDVGEIGCDALTATGRKWLRGPRGTGFLYIKTDWITRIEPATVDLAAADLAAPELMMHDTQLVIREDIKRFETWERNFALVLGLGAAAQYALDVGLDKIHRTVGNAASLIRQELKNINGVKIEDSPGTTCGIITVTSSNLSVSELKTGLSERGINTSVAGDYDGPLDLPTRNLNAVLRVSPHYYNSKGDIEKFLETMRVLNHQR